MTFARPHIETHSRSKGHSAVAGCAYRLGLAMVDERTGRAYDYTRKSGVVWSEHMAPEGAPAWQQDPAQFWNRVEAAEKRKDAQIARDFRIPIPLGFSERDAKDLAQRMARTLRDDLAAPVSVALHRDAERDRFGEVKDGTRGFHAHIFIPARGVEPDAMAAKKLGVFLDLGNKNKSGEWVEKWNEAWATHANNIIRERSLSIEQRTHLSYARLGVEREPEWKMGPKATALERAGVRTEVGKRLKAVHPTPPAMDHAQALAERKRERAQVEDPARKAWQARARELNELAERGGKALARASAEAEQRALERAAAEAQAQASWSLVEKHKALARLAGEQAKKLGREAADWHNTHRIRSRLGWVPESVKERQREAEAHRASEQRRLARAELAERQAKKDQEAARKAAEAQAQAQQRLAEVAAAVEQVRRHRQAHLELSPEAQERRRQARQLQERRSQREAAEAQRWAPTFQEALAARQRRNRGPSLSM